MGISFDYLDLTRPGVLETAIKSTTPSFSLCYQRLSGFYLSGGLTVLHSHSLHAFYRRNFSPLARVPNQPFAKSVRPTRSPFRAVSAVAIAVAGTGVAAVTSACAGVSLLLLVVLLLLAVACCCC